MSDFSKILKGGKGSGRHKSSYTGMGGMGVSAPLSSNATPEKQANAAKYAKINTDHITSQQAHTKEAVDANNKGKAQLRDLHLAARDAHGKAASNAATLMTGGKGEDQDKLTSEANAATAKTFGL